MPDISPPPGDDEALAAALHDRDQLADLLTRTTEKLDLNRGPGLMTVTEQTSRSRLAAWLDDAATPGADRGRKVADPAVIERALRDACVVDAQGHLIAYDDDGWRTGWRPVTEVAAELAALVAAIRAQPAPAGPRQAGGAGECRSGDGDGRCIDPRCPRHGVPDLVRDDGTLAGGASAPASPVPAEGAGETAGGER